MRNFLSFVVSRKTEPAAGKGYGVLGLAMLFVLAFGSSGWAQGLSKHQCTVNGTTVMAYFCQDDIVVADGAGSNGTSTGIGGVYFIDPATGNQTPISTGNLLKGVSSVTLDPTTGMILASSSQNGVIQIDPSNGQQTLTLQGGFPCYPFTSINTGQEFFNYPAGITVDPSDNSILVLDAGLNQTSYSVCDQTAKIIKIKNGQFSVVKKLNASNTDPLFAPLLHPMDIAADQSGIYVTDMSAPLGGAGMGGILYFDRSGNTQTIYAATTTQACPMGITVDSRNRVFATVFTYFSYGCSPTAVFHVDPINSVMGTTWSSPVPLAGNPPLQYPFGMDYDRNGNILIADEGANSCAGAVFRINPDTGATLQLSPSSSCSPPSNQTYLKSPADVVTAKGVIGPDKGTTNTAPSNATVTASAGTINENDSVSISGGFVDPDTADTHTVTIAWGDGSANTTLNLAAGSLTIPSTSHQYLDNQPGNAAYTVTVTVADASASATGTANITVNNVAPAISAVSGPNAPLAFGAAASVGVNFTDPGTLDTHTCSIDWGDGMVAAGSVTGTNTSGSCTGSRTYGSPGVYTVMMTVTDKDGAATSLAFKYVVIYDPTDGWVTGGGWINSPVGAFVSQPSLTGKANFGFQSKYQRGANVPTGNTEFNFKAAKFKFKSTAYQWLVISGAKAQYKGTGTIKMHVVAHANDTDCDIDAHFQAVSATYNFMITATDGSLVAGGSPDKFRIKITDSAGGVVYDNVPNGSDDISTEPQVIGGGKITIHSN
jgi:hypothetical protein